MYCIRMTAERAHSKPFEHILYNYETEEEAQEAMIGMFSIFKSAFSEYDCIACVEKMSVHDELRFDYD